jgi:hypothetical protein
MNVTLPARSFFAFAFPCRYRDEGDDLAGLFDGWDERFWLPDLMGLEGGRAFGKVCLSWSREGLCLGVEIGRKERLHADSRNPESGDCIRFWVDTRDVRDARRAGRYCHQFLALPGGGGDNGEGVLVIREKISLAREQTGSFGPVPAWAACRLGRRPRRYRMGIRIPAGALTGYDPSVCSRIGFGYLIHDRDFGTQSWSAGADLPVAYDPSMWGTAELVEA